jgi:hypothetical protein
MQATARQDAVVVAHQTAHDSSASIHPTSPLHSEVHSAPPSVRAHHNPQGHAVVTPNFSPLQGLISGGSQALSAFTSFALTKSAKIRGSKF